MFVKMGNDKQNSFMTDFTQFNDFNLTVRILFHGQEVGNIIGRRGETIKSIRDQSGATVLISNSLVPERIITIIGTPKHICKAIELIGLKVEEYFERENGGNCIGPIAPLTFKLIVPATQCGYIIGKGGCKIREIRETSGAAIQVVSNMLPNSTERLVLITGSAYTISKSIYHVCHLLLDSPLHGGTIPYNPQNANSGLSNGFGKHLKNFTYLGGVNSAVLATLARSQLRTGNRQNQNNENNQKDHTDQNSFSNIKTIRMTVSNDLIGCVIGRGGSKVAEIRKLSGALIYIAKNKGTGENKDRLISITGNKNSISLAKYLIEKSVQLQKANLEETDLSYIPDNESSSKIPEYSLPSIIPLAQLFTKPAFINAISSLTAFNGISGLMGALSSANESALIQTPGVHCSKTIFKRNPYSSVDKKKVNKYSPY